MTSIKKIVSSLLSFALVLGLVCSMSINAKAAEYTYTVKIHLAGTGNEGAHFVDGAIASGLTVQSAEVHGYNAEIIDNTLVVTGLMYSDKVSFDTPSAVALTPDENNYTKYYVKGLRQAGADESVSKPVFDVTKDIDYVVAYGVGEVVEYTVSYVDEAGNTLLPDQKYYAPKGEELYVSYKYVSGYTPNTYMYHTSQLEEGYTFVFRYTQGGFSIGETTTITEGGGMSYQYITVPGGVTVVAGGAAAGGAAGNAGAGAGNADAGADAGAATIEDAPTPTAPQDIVEIGDEQTALAGGVAEKAFPAFAWAIVAVAVACIIVTLVMLQRRKKAVAKVDNTKKSE